MTTIDFDKVQRMIAKGYINEQHHPTEPYRILNYSQKAQFDWVWTPETKACRGLVVDRNNDIIARPFEKFFSYEQLAGEVPNERFDAFEKLDGSLGVMYRDSNGNPHIASRGSFTSPQAKKGTQILQAKYQDVAFDSDFTYLFEIIYPQNRIVVDYGDLEELVLLAVIETETAVEQPLADVGVPIAKRYDGIDEFQTLLEQQDELREGFVVRFEGGQRVKIKFEEYKRLHKILTGVSAKHIWETLSSGKSLDELVDRVPDEYFKWVRETEESLRSQFEEIDRSAREQFRNAPSFETRKEAAMYFKQTEFPNLMFSMLDEKDYQAQIWKMIKPISGDIFKVRSDDSD